MLVFIFPKFHLKLSKKQLYIANLLFGSVLLRSKFEMTRISQEKQQKLAMKATRVLKLNKKNFSSMIY